jgi:serine protease
MAPSAVPQDECYCTTTTCGAGMVDAAAAVAAAQALNGTTVAITQSPASGLTAGQTLTLATNVAGLPSGRSVASTAWVIVDNGGGVVSAFASGANTATATITPATAGSFTVRADVTDNLGLVYSQTASVSVAAAPVVQPPSGGGGGGGAASAAWLLALLLAAFSLRPGKRLALARPRCRP